MRKPYKFLIVAVMMIVLVLYVFSIRNIPAKLTYGVSFSKFHSDELQLDWKETYLALLDDLKVRNIRLTAHWPMIEPEDGKFNFSELDFQMNGARQRGVSVILAVGRRLPGWPECHEPGWLSQSGSITNLPEGVASRPYGAGQSPSANFKQDRILKYIEAVVSRYKGYENIKYWQVENEPYLTFFSRSLCGELDEEFLQKEIDLVHRLDPTRPVLLTSSGEFDPWFQTYKKADVFGSSLYLYIWWKTGPIRYPITPAFFRIKQSLVELVYGKKPKILIELSTEPWLRQPIVGTPVETLLDRMGIDKFDEMIDFAGKTGFDTQYLWGAEWWYYMKTRQSHPEFWERTRILFN